MAGSKKSSKLSKPTQGESIPNSGKKSEKKNVANSSKSSIPAQFRIMVGSYEHNLLCLSVIIDPSQENQPVFQPVFHFEAHSRSIKTIDLAKRYLVTGSNDEHIRIYDLQKRKELGTLLSHQGTITTLRFSRESSDQQSDSDVKTGKWLLSGSEDGKIIIWRTKDWEALGTLKGHQQRVNDLAIHPSGRVAISVSQDKTIRLWNLMTVKKAAILKIKGKDHLGQSGEYVRWSPNGNHFIVGLLNQLFVYGTKSAKIIRKINFNSTLMCMDVLVVDNTEWLVTGHSNGTICFSKMENIVRENTNDNENENSREKSINVEELESEFVLHGHTNRVKGFSFFNCHSGEITIPLLISVSSDGKIVIWNLTRDVRDQIAVYDSGERLNCVVACPEDVEKSNTMKRRYNDLSESNGTNEGGFSESEYETDGEEIKKILRPNSKKNKKSKVSVTLE